MKKSKVNCQKSTETKRCRWQRMSRYLLPGAVLMLAAAGTAQAGECQVTLSQPAVDLGIHRGAIQGTEVFSARSVDITATCEGSGPVTLRLDGESGSRPETWRMGSVGAMTLSLEGYSSATGISGGQVNRPGLEAETLIPASGGSLHQRNMKGILLPPGSAVTLTPGAYGDNWQTVTVRLKMRWPTEAAMKKLREQAELNGEVQISASQ